MLHRLFWSAFCVIHCLNEADSARKGMVIKMKNEYYPFVNIPLPYAYDALEPFIDEKTMRLHHDRHLQTYIDNLNKILFENPSLQRMSLTEMLKNINSLPPSVRTEIKNNAGGVYNHRFFFDEMTDEKDTELSDGLLKAIEACFGSVEKFKEMFKKQALSVFGSGYVWLVFDGKGLKIITLPNQDSPLSYGFCPLLTVDVWEHAYYLKHYNVRAAYIDDWFNTVDWRTVSKNYGRCIGKNLSYM